MCYGLIVIFHFELFFALLPLTARKKMKKMKKQTKINSPKKQQQQPEDIIILHQKS